jgi:hypothetical protein
MTILKMIYFKDESLLHDNAYMFYKKLERQTFEHDPFGLMKHLVENTKEKILREFIGEFLEIIEEINRKISKAEDFNVSQIDSKTI